MRKNLLIKILVITSIGLVVWIAEYFLIAWLIEGSFWLHFFLTTALSASSGYSWPLSDLKERLSEQERLFDISDGQVVVLSDKAEEHEKEIDELKERVSELEEKISNLEKIV